MALFNFGKKTDDKKTCSCSCGGTAKSDNIKSEDDCRIKILGAGCKSCHNLYVNAMDAAEKFGLCAEVAYITDIPKAAAYGITLFPAIVIDEKVVSMGKILKPAEIEVLLHNTGVVS